MDMKTVITTIVFCLLLTSCSKDIETIDVNGTAFGIVSDLQTGDPISNVSVTLYQGLAWDCLGASEGITFTGTDGFFQLNDVDPSKYYFIVFRHAGYESLGQRINIRAGKNTELNAVMNPQ